MQITGVRELRGKAAGHAIYVLGSGPSAASFPLGELQGRISIALNAAMDLHDATYWLTGDQKYARWGAKHIAKHRSGTTNLVMNMDHIFWIEKRFPAEANVTVYGFTNKPDRSPDDFLAGRWTILTVALSLSVLMAATRVVLIGCDMGDVGGSWYAPGIKHPPPRKQHIYVGQWRKWVQYGFRSGLWPVDVVTPSPYFCANCPGTPVKTVSTEECLEC